MQWLYDWWERIDDWISENRPGGAPVPADVAVPEDEATEPVGELSRRFRLWKARENPTDYIRRRLDCILRITSGNLWMGCA